MQVYVGGRRSGKTRHLINLSHETGFPIVTRSEAMAKQIERDAMRIGKPTFGINWDKVKAVSGHACGRTVS